MAKHLATLTAGACAALLLLTPAPAAAESPYWQILSGSRPSNLHEPADQVQVVQKAPEGITRLNLGPTLVACIGGTDFLCDLFAGGASETAAELQEALEGPLAYGPGNVAVTEEPPAAGRFLVTSVGEDSGRWVPPLSTSTPNASAEIQTEGGSGHLILTLTNLGDAPVDATSTPLEITDTLPEGLAANSLFEPVAGAQGTAGPLDCELASAKQISCSFEGLLAPYEAIEIDARVFFEGAPPAVPEPGQVTVSGANAPTEIVPQPINVSDAPVPFGAEAFDAASEEEGGTETRRAGSHPLQLTNTVQFNSGRVIGPNRREAVVEQPGLPRNTRITLPAGLVGSATAVPECPLGVFLFRTGNFVNECPDESAIGVASVTVIESESLGYLREAVPIFNLPPQRGEPARFGFMPGGTPVLIDTAVDPDDEYKIKAFVRNAPQAAQVLSATVSIWGWPGDPRHDSVRGWNCVYFLAGEVPGECPTEHPNRNRTAFLRAPVSCGHPLGFEAELEPWNTPLGALIARASAQGAALGACNQVPFDPEISSALTSKRAESPSGLEFELAMDNVGLDEAGAIAEAQPKRAEVTLPEGVTVNPAVAEGLAVCSPAEYRRERFDSRPGEGCPEGSKIGSVQISTPLLSEQAQGALYQATPHENPFGSLIALYLVARIPERGILVKQAGVVRPDPETGQLVSTFDDIPAVPFDSFKLRFREGARAPLVTPPRCGSFETLARFVPWSATDPDHPLPGEIVTKTATTRVQRGVEGGACPSGRPFGPGFSAGSLNNAAAAYSPFAMRLTRRDGDQDLTRFSAALPTGTAAKLAGVAQCPEAAIAAAKSRDGLKERAAPSCPAASEIGTVSAGAGVGQVLTHAQGKLYLAGPLHGAPLSVVAIVPAVAGPFDVGTVVTREALRVHPRSARVLADGTSSDPIPHILAGIPLKVRDIRVNVDRPEFTFNPTSCAEKQTLATIWSGGADVFDPADDLPHALAARYQAAGCRALGFGPRVGLRLRGGVRRGAFPALRLTYIPRAKDANLRRFALRFPRSEFIEQGHFRTICTRVQFAAGAGFGSSCPKGSIYGRATVHTPILDQPLTGPVFLRSSNNNLPDVVLALHGPPSLPVKLEVPTRIDSVRGGLRAIASQTPDAPISRVVLNMQGGQKGLFVNSTHICRGTHRATIRLSAQNGATETLRPKLRAVRCRQLAKRNARRARLSGARVSR